jgi:hypothetical protein
MMRSRRKNKDLPPCSKSGKSDEEQEPDLTFAAHPSMLSQGTGFEKSQLPHQIMLEKKEHAPTLDF